MISWLSDRIAYGLIYVTYHIFKYNGHAFAKVSPELLEQMAVIANRHNQVIAAHFRTLKGWNDVRN